MRAWLLVAGIACLIISVVGLLIYGTAPSVPSPFPPTSGYKWHIPWAILLALFIILGGLIVNYVKKKRKGKKDDGAAKGMIIVCVSVIVLFCALMIYLPPKRQEKVSPPLATASPTPTPEVNNRRWKKMGTDGNR